MKASEHFRTTALRRLACPVPRALREGAQRQDCAAVTEPHSTWGVRLRRTSQLLVLPEVSVLQAEPADQGELSAPRPPPPTAQAHGAPAPAAHRAGTGLPGRADSLPHAGSPAPSFPAPRRPAERAPAGATALWLGGSHTGLCGRKAGTPGQ